MDGILFPGSPVPRAREACRSVRKGAGRVDELLLRRAREGDADAFERLMADLEPLVWRVCWHYTGQREDASDCGQEAMVRIWRGLSGYRYDCAFETWVYRIAANCCLDFLRRKRRDRSVSIEPLREEGFDPPDQGPGTEERVLTEDRHRRVRQAIAELPDDQRDALVLTQLEGKSYEEAARLLGTREGTVKSRINRARARLKEILSDEAELSPVSPVQRKERRSRP